VIIDYFNVKCVTVLPCEADAPLVIDPDIVLPFAIAFQRLKPVARWHPKVLQQNGTMKV
jgi:hypothetical protein